MFVTLSHVTQDLEEDSTWAGSRLARIHKTWIEVTDIEKHVSLLQYDISYSRKILQLQL